MRCYLGLFKTTTCTKFSIYAAVGMGRGAVRCGSSFAGPIMYRVLVCCGSTSPILICKLLPSRLPLVFVRSFELYECELDVLFFNYCTDTLVPVVALCTASFFRRWPGCAFLTYCARASADAAIAALHGQRRLDRVSLLAVLLRCLLNRTWYFGVHFNLFTLQSRGFNYR